MVIAPCQLDEEYKRILNEDNFNPNVDAQIKVNLMELAKNLDSQVDMSEKEFRNLLKTLFPDVPSYHLSTVVRLIKGGNKKTKMETLSSRLGGII